MMGLRMMVTSRDKMPRTAASRGALLCGLTALLLALAACSAEESEEPDASRINEGPTYLALEAAAIELEVPLNLLMAIAYTETHWEMAAGSTETGFDREGNVWGVMGLAEGRNLERAAGSVEEHIDDVRYDLRVNVRAAAALLAIIAANALGPDFAEKAALGDYWDVVAEYAGFADPETTISYVQEVMDCLRHGAGKTLSNGEIVEFHGAGDAVDERAYGEG